MWTSLWTNLTNEMSFICSGHACSTVSNLHIWSSGIADEQHLFTAAAAPGPSLTQGSSTADHFLHFHSVVVSLWLIRLSCSLNLGGGDEGDCCRAAMSSGELTPHQQPLDYCCSSGGRRSVWHPHRHSLCPGSLMQESPCYWENLQH